MNTLTHLKIYLNLKMCQNVFKCVKWFQKCWSKAVKSVQFTFVLVLCGPYWGCAVPKGHFFGPDSLTKGIFFTKTSENWHFGTKLSSIFFFFLLYFS